MLVQLRRRASWHTRRRGAASRAATKSVAKAAGKKKAQGRGASVGARGGARGGAREALHEVVHAPALAVVEVVDAEEPRTNVSALRQIRSLPTKAATGQPLIVEAPVGEHVSLSSTSHGDERPGKSKTLHVSLTFFQS